MTTYYTRQEAITRIEQALDRRGVPRVLISGIVANLGTLPPRVGQTAEFNRYLNKAIVLAGNVDYERQMSAGGNRDTSTIVAGDSGTSAEHAGQDAYKIFVKPFRDGGWSNPDAAAFKYYSYLAGVYADAPYWWRGAAGNLIRTVGERFGKNPDLGWQFFMGNVPDLGSEPYTYTQPGAQSGAGDNLNLGPGGGGGGYGSYKAPYTPPDRRNVEDMVRGQLARLVGRADEARVQTLTDLYMAEHRRAYDHPEIGLDPAASVTEQIRKQDDYKAVQALRPDFIDENAWVTQYQQGAMQSGLTAGRTEQFAIDQATIGASTADVAGAAGVASFAGGGQKTPEFLKRIQQGASMLLQGVR